MKAFHSLINEREKLLDALTDGVPWRQESDVRKRLNAVIRLINHRLAGATTAVEMDLMKRILEGKS